MAQWCDSSLNRQSLKPPVASAPRTAPAAFFFPHGLHFAFTGLRAVMCGITDRHQTDGISGMVPAHRPVVAPLPEAFMEDPDFDPFVTEGISAEEMADFQAWRVRVKGTNISDKTLLATDYLNHFNEIVMLIEMIPDMPDMLEECLIWQPKSYQEHFRDSGFSDKELAIEAFGHVPAKFKRPFEDTIAQAHQVVRHTLERIAADIQDGETGKLRMDCQASVAMIHRIIQIANGIIHGTAHVMEQAEIDQYLSAG